MVLKHFSTVSNNIALLELALEEIKTENKERRKKLLLPALDNLDL